MKQLLTLWNSLLLVKGLMIPRTMSRIAGAFMKITALMFTGNTFWNDKMSYKYYLGTCASLWVLIKYSIITYPSFWFWLVLVFIDIKTKTHWLITKFQAPLNGLQWSWQTVSTEGLDARQETRSWPLKLNHVFVDFCSILHTYNTTMCYVISMWVIG